MHDTGNLITMRFIQRSVQSNPDEIRESLDDPFVSKDGTKDG
jgi:hypothetical protein